jgi:hypothetical protein
MPKLWVAMPNVGVILPKLGVGEPSVWVGDPFRLGSECPKAIFPEDFTQRRGGAEDAEPSYDNSSLNMIYYLKIITQKYKNNIRYNNPAPLRPRASA